MPETSHLPGNMPRVSHVENEAMPIGASLCTPSVLEGVKHISVTVIMGWQLKCQFLIRVFVAYFLLNAQFCVNIIQVMTQSGANIMGLYILF